MVQGIREVVGEWEREKRIGGKDEAMDVEWDEPKMADLISAAEEYARAKILNVKLNNFIKQDQVF